MSDSVLTLSLVSLSRQIGSTRHEDIEWIAPDDLGTSSMGVQPGTPIGLSVDVTSVDDGVLVRVATEVDLVGECVRCLDEVRAHYEIDTTDLFFETAPEIDDEDPDVDEVRLIGPHDTIDLEPMLRDAIVTLVDDRPLCRPDCKGLWDAYSERRGDHLVDDDDLDVDPRLAPLASLLDDFEDGAR